MGSKSAISSQIDFTRSIITPAGKIVCEYILTIIILRKLEQALMSLKRITGSPKGSSAQRLGVASIQGKHDAQRLTFLHKGKALIRLSEREAVRHKVMKIEPTICEEVKQTGEFAARLDVPQK